MLFTHHVNVQREIYLDNNATTRPLDTVVKAVTSCMSAGFANPSSTHSAGRKVRAAIEKARETVASLIGANVPSSIVLTSGGTEGISQAFFIANETGRKPLDIIISSVEHAAVLESAENHAQKGARVHIIEVDQSGLFKMSNLESLLERLPRGAFVSLMMANNETGVVFSIPEIAGICKKFGALLHIDAVQAIGKMAVSVEDLQCDYLSLSAHKFHGPKGVGALYIRHGAPRLAMIKGHQENSTRGGTENVPGIIGMGVAAEDITSKTTINMTDTGKLRDTFETAILSAIAGTEVNGDRINRLSNTSNIFFPGKNSASMVEQLSARGILASAGAACTTGGKSSHVLRAMGLGDDRANSSLRFSLSKFTTAEEIERAIEAVKKVVLSSLDVYAVN